MLDMKEIEKEIECLENSESTSYAVCQKLAILYVVRDHMGGKGTTSSATPIKNTTTSSGPLPASEI